MPKLNPEQQKAIDQQIDSTFTQFDVNGDGVLDENEFRVLVEIVFGDVIFASNAEEKKKQLDNIYNDIIKKCDKNKDNKISKEEFKKALQPFFI